MTPTTTDWTPESTKPEPGRRVLVTTEEQHVVIATWEPRWKHWCDQEWMFLQVLAWAPLPAPYVPGGVA